MAAKYYSYLTKFNKFGNGIPQCYTVCRWPNTLLPGNAIYGSGTIGYILRKITWKLVRSEIIKLPKIHIISCHVCFTTKNKRNQTSLSSTKDSLLSGTEQLLFITCKRLLLDKTLRNFIPKSTLLVSQFLVSFCSVTLKVH